VRRFQPVIASTAFRVARRFGAGAPELIDDLVQDTFLKICSNNCRVLRDFNSQSPDAIFGLMKAVALSVAMDHFRGGLAAKRGGGRVEQPLTDYFAATLEHRESLPEAEREVLLRQIGEHLREVANPDTRERDCQIFWLHYRHGMEARAIAAIPGMGVTQKGVESTILRLRNHLRERLVNGRQRKSEGNPPGTSL